MTADTRGVWLATNCAQMGKRLCYSVTGSCKSCTLMIQSNML